jgi:hypothetical protein
VTAIDGVSEEIIMKRFLLFMMLAAAACLSCSLLPPATTMADILPRETDVPGWVVSDQYKMSSMKKIGQVSPLYGEYDPLELIVAEYGHLSDMSRTVRLEIIRFRSSLDSFGLFSRERGFDGERRYLDDNSYTTGDGVYSRMGRYYLKITGKNLGDQNSTALEQFRLAVMQNLKSQAGNDQLPDSFFIFSDKRSTRDIVYYKKGIDTIPGLKGLAVMRRTMDGRKFDVFYVKLLAGFEAEQEFHQLIKRGGDAFMLTKIANLQPAIRIISDSQYLFISHYKQWIFGVLNADTMDEGNKLIVFLSGEIKYRVDKKEKAKGREAPS